MAGTLLSGPAGAGKSQEARRLLEAASAPLVVIDFQAIIVALLLLERLPNGRYPQRRESEASWLLPMAEYTRQAMLTGAATMGIDAIATNSDGLPARRATLLSRLGPGATERILDPGFDVVTERLSNPDGTIDEQCISARDRWYSRRA